MPEKLGYNVHKHNKTFPDVRVDDSAIIRPIYRIETAQLVTLWEKRKQEGMLC